MILIFGLAACLDLSKGGDSGGIDGDGDSWDGWDVWGDEDDDATGRETGWYSGSDTGWDDGPSSTPPDFTLEWGSDGIFLHIGSSDPHWFGMAETGCADPAECWYGEDCIYGDLTGTYFYCHRVPTSGVTFQYGGDFSSLDEESETVFTSPSQADDVTYFIESADTADCWIWGHDPSYYAGLGCEAI